MTRAILELPAPPADLRISYGSGLLQFGELRLPSGAGPHPVVIGIHGGFWRARYNLSYFGHLCAALTARGVATWNIEYRRVGDAGGGWPGTLEDVALATDYLRQLAPEHSLDLGRVVPVGHSAGGHLALWLGARRRIPAGEPLHNPAPLPLLGAVSLAGVIDLRRAWELGLGDGAVAELLGGSPQDLPARYAAASPAALLPLGLPQLLIHGSDDEPVPFEMSQGYYDAALAQGDDVRLLPLPGAGHFAVVDPGAAEWSLVVDAVVGVALRSTEGTEGTERN